MQLFKAQQPISKKALRNKISIQKKLGSQHTQTQHAGHTNNNMAIFQPHCLIRTSSKAVKTWQTIQFN